MRGHMDASRCRNGYVLIVALVCVAVAAAVFTVLLRGVAAEQRLARTGQWQIEAAWLAESGLARAANRLGKDARYAGETWNLSPGALSGPLGAVVRIEIQPVPQHPDRRLVRVEADFPDDPVRRVRQTREATVRVRPQGAKS
jgi:hypothetical protein